MSFQSVGVILYSLLSLCHSWLYLAPASIHTCPPPTNTHTVPKNAAPFRIQAKVSWPLNGMEEPAEPQCRGAIFRVSPSVQGLLWSSMPGSAGQATTSSRPQPPGEWRSHRAGQPGGDSLWTSVAGEMLCLRIPRHLCPLVPRLA